MLSDLSGWAITAVAILGVLSVAAGVAVFVVDSMARATFALLASFLAVAGILLALDLVYLAVVTALMMTIEMAIMAVFMIMFMMNPAGLMPMTMVHNAKGSAAVGAGVFVLLAVGIWTIDWPTMNPVRPDDSTRQLGEAIMGSHMLVMLVIGIGLFATILAGTVLATARGRYDRLGPGLDAEHPDDPVPGGLRR
ncbi:NADH-quinone oxidoreductase subunit J [Blastococcus sp. MG754426]|uniref:NADH-quinone oxidoreductase subunit J n=1 Tax=unclassified Blastococcus TaxID=2619396 RepID=UPI001EF0C6FA|nr:MULTISPECIES: NADH-quinone oxidoreductase subunit J [unclassified Blastococcus]MCF6509970.1 NADH-quinone oxidoreductase subunit J [Blastococcus sp. MG754426]MCF6514360.1 NADH-quinone oxidoreductase subunit J [Blastococcus sp. MG754427]MCF6736117.1 NADH-quinone oxidoreductase subunit J [Blastococcus sp. KM273129]